MLRISADSAKRRAEVDYLLTKTDYQSLEQAAAGAGLSLAAGGGPA
ncbi:MAG: hypothetical protein WAT23_20320 [Chromatiaceae bacterium]